MTTSTTHEREPDVDEREQADTATAGRLISDLRTLAKMIAANPGLADGLAAALAQVHVVLPRSSTVTPGDHLRTAIEHGATTVPPVHIEALWDTRTYRLPEGVMHVSASRLIAPVLDLLGVER